MSALLTCFDCKTAFPRAGTRGPAPKRCQSCAVHAKRTPQRIAYERLYRRRERALGLRSAYEAAYNRRPEVRARARVRSRARWVSDPAYRERSLARWRDPHAGLVPPAPYTGHRWLQMAHDAVVRDLDPTSPLAEQYWDDMGEALLALLEGRDMRQALGDYRRREYVSRHLTVHIGDAWGDDEENEEHWINRLVPTTDSAEDEALARETVASYVLTRFGDVHTKSRRMKHKTQQPHRRRMQDAGWRKYA